MTQKRVAGFLTGPRYCNTWAIGQIYSAFNRSGIPLNTSGGVFYGQCMQRMLTEAIEKGVEVAVTVDFDSIFEPWHIKRLLSELEANPHIDALASLQSRRGMPYPLFTMGKSESAEFEGKPLPVTTAHFGLTAIRLDRLADVPKPWFFGKPNQDGEWGEGRVDDDIWFWRQWTDAGRSIYIDSGCSIGHMEEMISHFDEDGQHRFCYLNEWAQRGKVADESEIDS